MSVFLGLLSASSLAAAQSTGGCAEPIVNGTGFDVKYYDYSSEEASFSFESSISGGFSFGDDCGCGGSEIAEASGITDVFFLGESADTAFSAFGSVSISSEVDFSSVTNFTLQMTGYYKAPMDGQYNITLAADHESSLQIGRGSPCCGEVGAVNVTEYTVTTAGVSYETDFTTTSGVAYRAESQIVNLEAGFYYPMRIVYLNAMGPHVLNVDIIQPDGTKQSKFTNVYQIDSQAQCPTPPVLTSSSVSSSSAAKPSSSQTYTPTTPGVLTKASTRLTESATSSSMTAVSTTPSSTVAQTGFTNSAHSQIVSSQRSKIPSTSLPKGHVSSETSNKYTVPLVATSAHVEMPSSSSGPSSKSSNGPKSSISKQESSVKVPQESISTSSVLKSFVTSSVTSVNPIRLPKPSTSLGSSSKFPNGLGSSVSVSTRTTSVPGDSATTSTTPRPYTITSSGVITSAHLETPSNFDRLSTKSSTGPKSNASKQMSKSTVPIILSTGAVETPSGAKGSFSATSAKVFTTSKRVISSVGNITAVTTPLTESIITTVTTTEPCTTTSANMTKTDFTTRIYVTTLPCNETTSGKPSGPNGSGKGAKSTVSPSNSPSETGAASHVSTEAVVSAQTGHASSIPASASAIIDTPAGYEAHTTSSSFDAIPSVDSTVSAGTPNNGAHSARISESVPRVASQATGSRSSSSSVAMVNAASKRTMTVWGLTAGLLVVFA